MTKPQIKQHVEQHMSEFFDGYIVVGRVAGTGEAVVLAKAEDLPTKVSLLVCMHGICQDFAKDTANGFTG